MEEGGRSSRVPLKGLELGPKWVVDRGGLVDNAGQRRRSQRQALPAPRWRFGVPSRQPRRTTSSHLRRCFGCEAIDALSSRPVASDPFDADGALSESLFPIRAPTAAPMAPSDGRCREPCYGTWRIEQLETACCSCAVSRGSPRLVVPAVAAAAARRQPRRRRGPRRRARPSAATFSDWRRPRSAPRPSVAPRRQAPAPRAGRTVVLSRPRPRHSRRHRAGPRPHLRPPRPSPLSTPPRPPPFPPPPLLDEHPTRPPARPRPHARR